MLALATSEGAELGVREMLAFHVRMPEEIKQQLDKESKINGRSLNAEIVSRLQRSLEKQAAKGFKVEAPSGPGYGTTPRQLTDPERQILTIFQSMPPEKQLALISLFK